MKCLAVSWRLDNRRSKDSAVTICGELLGRWEQAGTAVGQGETSYAAEEEMRLGREQSVQTLYSMASLHC
ncbi:Interferon Gamma Receptor 1 [Manis pentadactyla]|nr:Interferon Gamma Receptor 1 [Manis pentadactyla]